MPRRRQEIGCLAPASQSTKLTGNESLKLGTENWKQQPQCPSTTGKNPTDEYLEGMMNEAPGPINFTMFLTMFGEKLNGTDPEDVIRNAFACFDEEASGQCTRETWAREGAPGCYKGRSPSSQCPGHTA